MRVEVVVLLLMLFATACQRQSETITPPSSPLRPGEYDPGFPIKPRPACESEVVAAVGKSDVAEVKRLAAAGAVFTCALADDSLPLDDAVKREKAPHVYRSEPGCAHTSGMTPLMFAASVGDLNVLGALLERSDVDLGLKDWNGRTAVEYAQRAGYPDAVYELRRGVRLRTIFSQRFGVKPNAN
jgi:hypothetical protein